MSQRFLRCFLSFWPGVGGGTRTRTLLKVLNFKSSASTNFATPTSYTLVILSPLRLPVSPRSHGAEPSPAQRPARGRLDRFFRWNLSWACADRAVARRRMPRDRTPSSSAPTLTSVKPSSAIVRRFRPGLFEPLRVRLREAAGVIRTKKECVGGFNRSAQRPRRR